jgi:hypothetical protein
MRTLSAGYPQLSLASIDELDGSIGMQCCEGLALTRRDVCRRSPRVTGTG